MNIISNPEGEKPDHGETRQKSYVEDKLTNSIDRFENDIEFLERYQSMEPKSRLEGFGFRLMRWYNKDYRSEKQRLETNQYLCNRISLVSAPIFVLSIVPPTNTGMAVLTGLIGAGSFVSACIFEATLDDLKSEDKRCACQ